MASRPLLIMVGADKGGVGKTTVSRLLSDYMNDANIKYKAFDTESPLGVLKRFYPETTEVLDLTDVSNQMKIFDSLSTESITLIDIRAGLLSPTLKDLGDIGLIDMASDKKITLVILHVIGPNLASLREIETTAQAIPNSTHFLVKNHTNKSTFFDWDPASHAAALGNPRSGIIDIPQLNEMAAEHIENAGVSYAEFLKDTLNQSMVLRGYTNTWRREVFRQFNVVNLDKILLT